MKPSFESLLRHQASGVRMLLEVRMNAGLRARIAPEDIMQDVFVEALRSKSAFEYRGEQGFRRWLATIAERRLARAYDELVRRPRAVRIKACGADSGSRIGDSALAGTATTASRAAARREDLAAMMRVLRHLSEEHREVITLRKLHELPLKEVAARMNRTEPAAAMLLQRALARTRLALEEEGVASSSADKEQDQQRDNDERRQT